MVVLIICKIKEDPIKNESGRVATRLYVDFSDIQGQITPHSKVGSGRNSFKHLYMSSLPAKMVKIQSKLKRLEWPQHIAHCKS